MIFLMNLCRRQDKEEKKEWIDTDYSDYLFANACIKVAGYYLFQNET